MDDQNNVISFVISDTDGLPDNSWESIKDMLLQFLGISFIDFTKAAGGQNALLNLYGPLEHDSVKDMESKITECFEVNGYLVHVTHVTWNAAFVLKFEKAIQKVDELFMEIQTNEFMVDQEGKKVDIITMVEIADMQMILIIMGNPIDEYLTCCKVGQIEKLVEMYRVNSIGSLKFVYGDGKEEELLSGKIWSQPKCWKDNEIGLALCSLAESEESGEIEKQTPGFETCQTLCIKDPFVAEKCQLIGDMAEKLKIEDCLVQVDCASRTIKISGRTDEFLQVAVKLMETQLKMFQFEEIPFLSRKLFVLFTENSIVKETFRKIQIKNGLEGVMLGDREGKVGVLGLSWVKIRNFIEWLGRFITQESVDFHHDHHHDGVSKMEEYFALLEQNKCVSIDVLKDKILVQGMASDVFMILPNVKSYLLRFKDFLLDDEDEDTIRYMMDMGIKGTICTILEPGKKVCLFKMNDDGKNLVINDSKRRIFYAAPVLYKAVKPQNNTYFKSLSKFTKVIIDYQKEVDMMALVDYWKKHIEECYVITSFFGEFDYAKVSKAFANARFIYEIDISKKVIHIFCKTNQVGNLYFTLVECLFVIKDKILFDFPHSLRNHSFDKGLDACQDGFDFKIPTDTIQVKGPPNVDDIIKTHLNRAVDPSHPREAPVLDQVPLVGQALFKDQAALVNQAILLDTAFFRNQTSRPAQAYFLDQAARINQAALMNQDARQGQGRRQARAGAAGNPWSPRCNLS